MKNFLIAIFLLLTLSTNSYSDTLELVSKSNSAFYPQSINHRNFIALRSGKGRFAIKKLNGKIRKVSKSIIGHIVSDINPSGKFIVETESNELFLINKNASSEKINLNIKTEANPEDPSEFQYLGFTHNNKVVFEDLANKRFGIYDTKDKTTVFIDIPFVGYDYTNKGFDVDSKNRLLFRYNGNKIGLLNTNDNTLVELFERNLSSDTTLILLKNTILEIQNLISVVNKGSTIQKLDLLTGEPLKVTNKNIKIAYKKNGLFLGKIKRKGKKALVNEIIGNHCLVANGKESTGDFFDINFGYSERPIRFNKNNLAIVKTGDIEQIFQLTKSIFSIENEFCPIIEIKSIDQDFNKDQLTVSFRALTPDGRPLRERGIAYGFEDKLFNTKPDGSAKVKTSPAFADVIFPYNHSKYRPIFVFNGDDGV